jgi:hypothetical protein
LAGQVTDVTIKRQCLFQAGGSVRVIAGLLLHDAQFAERVFTDPVSGLARCGQCGLVERRGLIPMTAGRQEAAHRAGDLECIRGPPVDGSVVGGCLQVWALGFKPGGSLLKCGQAWRERVACKQLLLLLDDAAGSEQVRPRLPGTPGCLVLITSRRRLLGLEDATAVSLDTLRPGDAAALFVRLAAQPGPGADGPAKTLVGAVAGARAAAR